MNSLHHRNISATSCMRYMPGTGYPISPDTCVRACVRAYVRRRFHHLRNCARVFGAKLLENREEVSFATNIGEG